jgi:hypothetical protein
VAELIGEKKEKVLNWPANVDPLRPGRIGLLELAKGCHKVLDLAGRRGFAGFEVLFNA